ncbi:hypothetical protein [uncultured Roseobacter sp.]|uniref:hypothetical protein n=1 Tax=uncultured Roseobacter sp. TaxID=114847 RepID=UPI00261AE519|nr:hypothetical protein [uncultured Roseobacter sp.]
MPLIRTRTDIDDLLDGPTPAEEKLLAACLAGEPCHLGDDVPPEGPPDPQHRIRADVLRYLIIGGCETHPVADWGVDLYGAHVTGALDLRLATAKGVTGLIRCRFDEPIGALQAKLQLLNLDGSAFPELNAQGAKVKGDIFLRKVTAEATVRVTGATIGGQLECDDAIFNATFGDAFNAQGARVTGSVYLRSITAEATVRVASATIGGQLGCIGARFNATAGHAFNAQGVQVTGSVFLKDITAKATVDVNSATIGGQLECDDAIFNATFGDAFNAQGARVTGSVYLRSITAEATVRVNSATIGGQLDCDGATFNATFGDALNAQGAQVTGGFFFRGVRTGQGVIDLTAAQVGTLVDDPHSWPPKDRLVLDGFIYSRVENAEFPRLSDRLDWLAKGSTWGHEFYPQPYTQLAKTYREMGQDGDARDILAERERRLLRHRFFSKVTLHNGTPEDGVTLRQINFHVILWSFLARIVVGYGYHPFRSVMILFALIALSAVFADRAWQTGGITPNSAHVLVSPGWLAHHAVEGVPTHVWIGEVIPAGWSADPETPEQMWRDTAPGRDWETFNALAYGADIAIPIIAFGQTDAWAPSATRGAWGTFLWWWRWVATTTGWIVTGLAAAAVTGIIRRD